MNEIVVGFGTHDRSTRALEWSAQLAARAGWHVVVLNVFHPTYVELSPDSHRELIAKQRASIQDVMHQTGHDDFEIRIGEGEAVDELLRVGNQTGAGLIVVGHRDSMGPGGFGEHGPAEILFRRSDLPFVVVGDGAPIPTPTGPLNIIVGLDGSTANADSVVSIARIAKDIGATAIPVLSVNTGASTTRDHYGSRLLHQDEATAIAAKLPGSENLRTINEAPVQGLIDVADEVNAIMIAVGTRGHRSLHDLVAGQIGRHLIEHSNRAVLISPHH